MSAFEIVKRTNLLDWSLLAVGLARGWCKKEDIVEYAEQRVLQNDGEMNDYLISFIADQHLSDNELITACVSLVDSLGEGSFKEEKPSEALEKWRFAHLVSVLEGVSSVETKIDALQELYGEFGFPDDMASCSIYCDDGVDPLAAARSVVDALAKRLFGH